MFGTVCVLVMVLVCFVTLCLQAERHAKKARFDRNALCTGMIAALKMLSEMTYTSAALMRGVDALVVNELAKHGIDPHDDIPAPRMPKGWDSTATPDMSEEANAAAQEVAQDIMG